MSWREKAQEEIAKGKRAARRMIMALEKKHQVELSKEFSSLFGLEWEQNKRLVDLDRKFSKVSAEAKKEVAALDKDYYSKVTSVM